MTCLSCIVSIDCMSAQFIYFLIYCELYCEFQISHAYLHLHKLQGEWAQAFGAKVYGIV